MKYNFKKFEGRYSKNEAYVSINNSNLSISAKAYDVLEKPEVVDVYIDEKNKAIKILKGNDRVVNNKNIGSTSFAKVLPKGKYKMVESNIFVKES